MAFSLPVSASTTSNSPRSEVTQTFAERYPSASVGGTCTGALDHNGGCLRIVDAAGEASSTSAMKSPVPNTRGNASLVIGNPPAAGATPRAETNTGRR